MQPPTRRHALAALCAAGCAFGRHAAGAATDAASAREAATRPSDPGANWIAWTAGACWVGAPGLGLRRLAVELAPGIAPIATARGIVVVDAAGRMRRLSADPTAREPALEVSFDQPVHAFAASADGHWVLAAHGEQLSVLDADGAVRKTFAGTDLARRRQARASRLFALASRRCFVAIWPGLEELWEISYDSAAAPIFDGLVHDYRLGEGIASSGFLGARRTLLPGAFPDITFADLRAPWVAGTLADRVVIVHLDVRRAIATLPVAGARPGLALLRSQAGGASQWWLPAGDELWVYATDRWMPIERHRLPAPVQGLQALGSELWALSGAVGRASAHHWHQGVWKAIETGSAAVLALRADPSGSGLLLASADPAQLRLVDARGLLLQAIPWPEAPRALGVAWLPRPA